MDVESESEQHKALIYGVKTETGEKSFIIMESFMHKDGDLIRVFMNDNDFPVIMGNRKNIGLGYWQFECRQVEERQVTQRSQPKKKGYDFI
jgi:phage major head subunit gpT-like protein